MNTLDIVVLVLFAVIAAVGIGSHSDNTAADWMGRVGIVGVAIWLCWMFLRPGGESAHGLVDTLQNLFSQ